MGETCSPDVPQLWFGGARWGEDAFFADKRVKPLAVGGTQHVVVGDREASRPLPIAFDAVGSGVIGVTASAGGIVTVVATEPGVGALDIRDPQGRLDDRVALEAEEIVNVGLIPALDPGYARPGEEGPWFLHAGTELLAVVVLRSANGTRVADDGLLVAEPSATTDDWDTVVLRAAPGAAQVPLHVTAGGASSDLSVSITDRVDRVEAVDVAIEASHEMTFTLGDLRYDRTCFRGVRDGVPVLGGEIAAIATAPVTADTYRACMWLDASGTGTAAVTLTIDGVSATYTVHVVR